MNRKVNQKVVDVEQATKLANDRFGYQRALEIVLNRFLNKEDSLLALSAAKDRNFNEFEKLIERVKPL